MQDSPSFRPDLERLEAREAPASMSSSASAFGGMASLSQFSTTLLTQPVSNIISTMQSLQTKLQTDQNTLTSAINSGATAQTIAGDFGAASSDFGQIKALNTAVQGLIQSNQFFLLLTMFNSQNQQGQNQNNNNNNNNNDDNNNDNNNNNNNQQGQNANSNSMSNLFSLFAFFTLAQDAQTATSTLNAATGIANTALPGGYPTIASVA
jgi:hypothetical protein